MGAVLLAAVVAMLCAGCGSDSGASTESGEPTLTKQQFVKRADVYCTRGYKAQARAMERYAREHGFSREPSQAEREEVNTAVVLGFVRRKIEFFESLPAPEGDEQEIQRMVASMERGLEQSEENPASLAKPYDPEPFTDTRHLTAEYGPWICGQA